MGFLYQVLKDVSEKQPYSVGKEELKKLLNDLESKLSTGREGFSVIAQVAEKVGEYNESVRKQNDDIKNKITDLDSQMKQLKQSVSEDLKRNAAAGAGRIVQGSVDSADQLVKTCLSNANKFNKSIDTENDENVRNAINDLNSIVRYNVNKARACVTLETEHFTALSSKQQEHIKVMRKKIERCLTDLGSCVNDNIKRKVKNLVDELSKKVLEIKRQLEEIKKQLIEYIAELTTWIGQAEPLIKSAFGKVEQLLKEVNERDSEKRPMLITSAIEQIKAAVAMLHGAGEEARKQVKEKVTAALKQVKVMNDELKKDLYKVKQEIQNAIVRHVKEQIKTPYDALEGNVKKDLTTLKGKIEGELEPILKSSRDFNTKFIGTKDAIVTAMKNLEGDTDKLKDLAKIEETNSSKKVTAPLLKGIGGKTDPFISLTTYFSKLHSEVMEPIKKAMEGIGKGVSTGGQRANKDELANALKMLKAEDDFKALNTVVGGTVPSGDLNGINSLLGVDLKKIDLTRYAADIKSVIAKLETNSLSKLHLQSLLNSLAAISQAVSSHSKSIVEEVMHKLKEKAQEEITNVAKDISQKIRKIQNAAQNHTDTAKYGDSVRQTAAGLTKLASDFGNEINTKLAMLLVYMENNIFKKPAGSIGDDNYDLGNNLMSNFKSAYDALKNGELKEETFKKFVEEILRKEIGPDILAVGSDEGNTVSNLEKDKFSNYEGQVQQDSIALSLGNLDNLKGNIPSKIMDIREQVVKALEKIDGEKVYAQQEIDKITANLHQLCQNVKAAGEHAQGSPKQLQDTYFHTSEFVNGGIRIIKYKLTNLQEDDLAKAIKEANQFLTDAQKIRDDTTRSLKIDVDGQVKEVKRQLTSELERQYITTMALQLDNFADRVTEHLKGLPEAIENDKHTGFKGFMEAFEGKPEVKPRDKYAFEAVKVELSKLEEFKTAVTKKQASKKEEFETLSEAFKKWYINLHLYVHKQIIKVYDNEVEKNSAGTPAHDYPRKFSAIYDALNELLIHLSRNSRFDCHVPEMLDNVVGALADLNPQNFATVTTPVLDVMVSGLTNFIGVLRRVYIPAYDRQTFEGLLRTEETKTDDAGQTKKLTHLTDHGKKCAKVFLTLLCTMMSSLTILKHNCKSLTKQQINKSTDVGRQFAELGFRVSDEGKQNGELHDTSLITGEYIANSLTFRIKNADKIEHLKTCLQNKDRLTSNVSIFDILKCIYRHFEEYSEVCHIASSSSKSPCSVYEMLVWLTGLPYTAANSVMRHATITELFENADKQVTDAEISGTLVGDSPIKARPYDITFNKVMKAIDHVCSKSYGILTTVAGHGDADTTYGSDFCNNSLKLKYPSSGEDCFQMLLDVLWRLLPALRYLQQQCVLNDKYGGWANCQYGKGVPPSNWPCSEHPSDEAKCQANCQANGKPTCRPTSPLQSYLHDSLVGHLPHRVTSIGCRSVCSNCPRNKPGMPCLTPMGFRGFSGSAKTGKYIYEMISTFFGTGLISSVLCLVPKPPSTLPEHFSFASSLVKDWQYGGSSMENDFQSCIETSIDKLSIRLNESRSEFTDTLRDVYGSSSSSHSAQGHVAAYTDLASLSRNATCSGLDVQCGPYLQSTCYDAYNYLAHKHSDTYFSWALYLPWAFWNYLKSLLDAFQQIDCGSFGCRGCPCKPGSHGKESNCKCNTIVGCRGVAPTFYSYGFTLGDAQALMRTDSVKNCANFVTQLKALLNSNYFKTLFEKCDEFLFTIRQPFIWLNVALWSLSLFYLICVMVGRLDVLHIRSHLRIPSSHRITAQSLLAAAQVGRLAKISYLQP